MSPKQFVKPAVAQENAGKAKRHVQRGFRHLRGCVIAQRTFALKSTDDLSWTRKSYLDSLPHLYRTLASFSPLFNNKNNNDTTSISFTVNRYSEI